MSEEPSDEECIARAMLTGLYYSPTWRYEGRRCLYKTHWSTGREPSRYVEYLDPVTLEVMGEQSISDHYLTISGVIAMTDQTIEHDPNQTEMALAPQPAQPVQIPISTRVEQYIKLRDQIKAEDEKHKDRMEPARNALERLNNVLLQMLEQVGGEGIKTEYGSVFKTTKRSASLEDADQFMRHVIGTEAWDLLERKASLLAVEEFVKENGVLPPGVKLSSRAVVGVRRA